MIKGASVSRPVFAVPADLELDLDPIRANWIIEGTPQARSACLVRSADRTFSVVAWSCTAGRFNWHYAVDETLYIVSGEALVTDEKGETRRLRPGDVAYFPAGSRTAWHVPHEVRKVAMCRHSMPRPVGTVLRTWNKAVNRLTGFFAGGGEPARHPAMRREGARAASAQAMCGVIDKAAARP
jgi:uncharacterized cupin superfamily protein